MQVTRSVWLGAALAAARDTALSGPAEQTPTTVRHAYNASARGGVSLDVARNVDLAAGVGAGVTTGVSLRRSAGQADDIDQGGVFVETVADAGVGITESLKLLFGVAGRYRLLSTGDQDKRLPLRIPDVMPDLSAELRVGAGWTFGAQP
jgi:hypothetical protein